MRHLLVLLLVAAPGFAGAQGLLDFRHDLAFEAGAIEAVAEHAYRARLQTLKAAGQLDTNKALLRQLRNLLARLQPAAKLERPEATAIAWEIHTCRSCGENASAMAGGKLLVGEEFVTALALTDDELAYLLAHEMGHVLAEHTREFATTARFFLANGRNREYWDIQNELDESFGENLRMAPLFTQQESEADYIGMVLGARSGFAPEAMLSMLRKLSPASALDDEPAAGFGFHPRASDRIGHAQAMLETARRIRAIGMR